MRRTLPLLALLGLLMAVTSLPAAADSQVRIVRLSFIVGDVKMDRRDGEGIERAIQNTPITQSMRIVTGDDGRAEVEFEEGSTIRLAPNSAIEFTRLSLRDSGGKFNEVEITEGTAYFDVDLGKRDDFTVNFGRRTLTLERSAKFRVNVDRSEARVAVRNGSVEFSGPSGEVGIGKHHTALLDLNDIDRFSIEKKYAEEAYDDWDREQDDYHARNFGAHSGLNSPYSYGMSDLNYYGSYFDAPGYGRVWRPFGASYGWDPFMDGAWSWYPGVGYTWVSAYPWGWTPYRYGSWLFLPGFGWTWQPGMWSAWCPTPRVLNAPANWIPPQRPGTRTVGTILMGKGAAGTGNDGGRTVIGTLGDGRIVRRMESGEAGLGVLRGHPLPKMIVGPGTGSGTTVGPRVSVGPDAHVGPGGIREDHPTPGSGRSPSAPSSPTPAPAPRITPVPRSAPSAPPSPAPRMGSGSMTSGGSRPPVKH